MRPLIKQQQPDQHCVEQTREAAPVRTCIDGSPLFKKAKLQTTGTKLIATKQYPDLLH